MIIFFCDTAVEMGQIKFLPFSYVAKYDPETHDIWVNNQILNSTLTLYNGW